MREPGVALAERPQLNTPSYAAPVLAQYIGEQDPILGEHGRYVSLREKGFL